MAKGVRKFGLYVAGCMFHCEGCYNATWSFNVGILTPELEERVWQIYQNLMFRAGILGGEPFLNLSNILPLVKRIRKELQKEISGLGRATLGKR